jgi:hypothetical protein
MVHRARADDDGGDRTVADQLAQRLQPLPVDVGAERLPAMLRSSRAGRPTSARLTTERPLLLGAAPSLLKSSRDGA